MKKIIILIIMLIVMFSTFSTCWGWPIYYKPEYRGRIIDAETKAPIGGAVVVVVYYEERIIGNVGGSVDRILDAKEILTDSKGEFYFPSYNSLTPFWRESGADFIIFKPGYMSSNGPLENINTETFFSADVVGKEGEIRRNYGKPEVWKGPLGVVELKKVSPDRAMPPSGIPTGYGVKELPLLYKAINEDLKNRGVKGEYK